MGPTQEDVAKRANVSRALVSLVMRDSPKVSAERRTKVLQAAEELGYRPNAFARSLASKRVTTIGVLVNDVTNPYFGALYASLAKAADAAGYAVLTAPGTRQARREEALVNTLLEHRVAGLALLSPLMSGPALKAVCAASPTVVIGRETTINQVDVVTTDENQAAESVIRRLTELGHRDIAHINGGSNGPARDRASAYRKVMADFGLAPREINGAFTEKGGQLGAQALLASAQLPTAIMAANDLIAVGVMGVLRSAGLTIPDDISVVGYDNSQIAQLDLVQLTSVHQSIEQFGPAAIEALIRRIEDPDRLRSVRRIETRLVERTTLAAART